MFQCQIGVIHLLAAFPKELRFVAPAITVAGGSPVFFWEQVRLMERLHSLNWVEVRVWVWTGQDLISDDFRIVVPCYLSQWVAVVLLWFTILDDFDS